MFDSRLLKRFFQIMGVWPIGTVVKLADGRVAVVRRQNEDDIWKPVVEVIHPEHNGEMLDLKEDPNHTNIEYHIGSPDEAQKYLDLI
jgi:hypothetical protein